MKFKLVENIILDDLNESILDERFTDPDHRHQHAFDHLDGYVTTYGAEKEYNLSSAEDGEEAEKEYERVGTEFAKKYYKTAGASDKYEIGDNPTEFPVGFETEGGDYFLYDPKKKAVVTLVPPGRKYNDTDDLSTKDDLIITSFYGPCSRDKYKVKRRRIPSTDSDGNPNFAYKDELPQTKILMSVKESDSDPKKWPEDEKKEFETCMAELEAEFLKSSDKGYNGKYKNGSETKKTKERTSIRNKLIDKHIKAKVKELMANIE